MVQFHLFMKWTVLVWLNAAVSFWIALSDYIQLADILAMVAGVFTFVAIYAAIDYQMLKKNAVKLRKLLFISAGIKACTQLYPVVEMMTGAISQHLFSLLSFDKIPFISTYLITLTDGVLLSILVALFMLTGKFVCLIKRSHSV